MWAYLLVCLLTFYSSNAQASLAGEKVYRITPATESQLSFLRSWVESMEEELDVWAEPGRVGDNLDVRVPANLIESFEKALQGEALEYSVVIDDLDKLVAEEAESNKPSSAYGDSFEYDKYNTFTAIVNELRRIHSAFPQKTALFTVGKTYENRDMVGITVSSGTWDNRKPAIWIDGGIHAREWISPATVMWFLRTLIISGDSRVTEILAKYNFYFLPVFNADGYAYTHTDRSNRFWRKTRSKRYGSCVGVDPNRNWDYNFGGVGTSNNPCSNVFHGRKAWSEQEVANVANYLKQIPTVKAYFNVHAYSQLVLTPLGDTKVLPPDYPEISRVAKVFSDEIVKMYGTQYQYGPSSRILYAVAGASNDWTYAKLKIRYSYVIELRDKGQYGFLLPASQIRPSGEETAQAFIAAIQAMK